MKPHISMALHLLAAGSLLASGDVAPGINRFAAASYRQLERTEGNLIFSPFNISTALSMLLEGARGQTAAGMAATLTQGDPGAGYHAAVAALAAQLTKRANLKGNDLGIANGVWVQRGFTLQPEFAHTMQTVYRAPLTPLDFGNAEEASREINAWTAKQTKDKIPELFAPGAIKADTRLVLTSAIYFLGKWHLPFDANNTSSDTFRLGGNRTADARFMHQKGNFLYAETPMVQILEMKYEGTRLAFDILLPKATAGLSVLERTMAPDALAAWLGSLSSQEVEVAVPKFRAESTFSLQDMLSRMGMADAFGKNADFSGIDGKRDLYLGAAIHKAFVDVTEEGTEAAAATGMTMRPLAMRQNQTVFHADHPFLFLIRDTDSGVILFQGRLVEP